MYLVFAACIVWHALMPCSWQAGSGASSGCGRVHAGCLLAAQPDIMPPDVPMQIAIVLEYMNGGSLGDILQKVRPAAGLSARPYRGLPAYSEARHGSRLKHCPAQTPKTRVSVMSTASL